MEARTAVVALAEAAASAAETASAATAEVGASALVWRHEVAFYRAQDSWYEIIEAKTSAAEAAIDARTAATCCGEMCGSTSAGAILELGEQAAIAIAAAAKAVAALGRSVRAAAWFATELTNPAPRIPVTS